MVAGGGVQGPLTPCNISRGPQHVQGRIDDLIFRRGPPDHRECPNVQTMMAVRSLPLSRLAALAEIGGAWLFWQGAREQRGLLWLGALRVFLPGRRVRTRFSCLSTTQAVAR